MLHTLPTSRQAYRHAVLPFEDGHFPDNLGAVVQHTVLTGQKPPRIVIHDEDNDWLIGDGVNDPNLDGASVVVCISHIADADPSVMGEGGATFRVPRRP